MNTTVISLSTADLMLLDWSSLKYTIYIFFVFSFK